MNTIHEQIYEVIKAMVANLIICGIVVGLGLHTMTREGSDIFLRIRRCLDRCDVIHFCGRVHIQFVCYCSS